MKRPAMIMNKGNMVYKTAQAKQLVSSAIKRAERMANDTDKAQREEKQNCKACYYTSRIGGCAITSQECMCCGKNEMYASTATDVLCRDCAKKHGLCKHCGGDIEMRERRKEWPEPSN